MQHLRIFAFALLVACGGSSGSQPQTTPAPAATAGASTTPSDHELCVAVMQRSRTCTDVYIPALVDARAAADHPAGIKDAVAKDRAGMIAQAKQEWATDSTDANIDTACTKILSAGVQPGTREASVACQAKTDCAAFSACILPVESQAWH